ncbi:MAG: hypothetical protein ACK5QJ_17740 [Microcystis sp.]
MSAFLHLEINFARLLTFLFFPSFLNHCHSFLADARDFNHKPKWATMRLAVTEPTPLIKPLPKYFSSPLYFKLLPVLGMIFPNSFKLQGLPGLNVGQVTHYRHQFPHSGGLNPGDGVARFFGVVVDTFDYASGGFGGLGGF